MSSASNFKVLSLLLQAQQYANASRLKRAGFTEDLEQARAATNTTPTPKQVAAENYAKGVVKVRGLTIAIENPKGSMRRGTDKSGKKWEQKMAWDYGYAKGVDAVDGDKLDIFLGPDPENGKIFVVDQVLDGAYDESKVMLGFPSEAAAREGYLANYQAGWKGLGHITEMSDEKFRTWCKGGQTEMAKSAVVRRHGDQWELWTKDGKRRLGTHSSAREAYAQEYAIQKSEERREKHAGAPGFWRSLGVGTLGAVPGAAIGSLSGHGASHLLGIDEEDKARLIATILASAGGALGGALARELDGQFVSRNWDEEGNKIRNIRSVGEPLDPLHRIVQRSVDVPVLRPQ